MTSASLTSLLAQRVLGWAVAEDRFLMRDRRWTPRWRFQPFKRIEDAFRLLEAATPEEYTMGGDNQGNFRAEVRISGITGSACGATKARVISFAIARAAGIEIEDGDSDAV